MRPVIFGSWALILVFSFSAYAGEPIGDSELTADTAFSAEIAPLSTAAGCVNVESGRFFFSDQDLFIDGSSPLHFGRSYDSGLKWKSEFGYRFGCSFATRMDKLEKLCEGKYFLSMEYSREGSRIPLEADEVNWIGDGNSYVFTFDRSRTSGFTNIGFGEVSGRTHPKNIKVELRCSTWEKRNKNGKWIVSYGDGTKKYYDCVGRRYHIGLLRKEKLPNGTDRYYEYMDYKLGYALKKVWTTNKSQTKVINQIDFNYSDKLLCEAKGSGGQTVHYSLSKRKFYVDDLNGKKIGLLNSVSGAHLPKTVYTNRKATDQYLYAKIKRVEKPNNRFLDIQYCHRKKDPDGHILDGKVESLSAPVGQDETPIKIFRFAYYPRDDRTTVRDAYKTRTHYSFRNGRTYLVEEFWRDPSDELYRCQKDFWGVAGSLLARTLQKDKKKVCRGSSFKYDKYGNITEKSFHGNLTGKAQEIFLVDKRGLPKGGQNVESCSCHYKHGAFNLLVNEKDDFGKEVSLFYKEGTDLLTKQLQKERNHINKRVFNIYNDCAVLLESIEDDGCGEEPSDLTDVTVRRIRRVIPSEDFPTFGKPLEILEAYYDPVSGEEALLNRVECSYNDHAFLTEKRVFDANNEHIYTLFYTYDDRDRLIEETDPLGQVTKYGYDENFNKVYEERIGSGKKIFYHYDFSDRLIAEEERHDDGEVFITKHAYDYVHNRIWTEDPFGNRTDFYYDPFHRIVLTKFPETMTKEGQVIRPEQRYGYNCADDCTWAKDERGFVTETKYNAYGRPIHITHPDGNQERFEYLLNGRLKKWDTADTVTERSYDGGGRVIHEITTDRNGALLKEISREYKGDLLVKEDDSTQCSAEYLYDGAGRKIEGRREDYRTTFVCDSLGRLWKSCHWLSDGSCQVQIIEYDLLNRVIEERTEDGQGNVLRKSQYEYDINDNRTHEHFFIDEINCDTTLTLYNCRGEPIEITDALGNETHIAYDYHHQNELGQEVLRKEITDPLGKQIIEVYDAYGRISSIEQRNSFGECVAHQVSFYDACGNQVRTVHNVMEGTTKIGEYSIDKEHDCMGNVIFLSEQRESHAPKTTQYSYDAANRLEVLTKPDGVDIRYTYNGLGHITSQTSSNGSIDYSYTYDAHYNPIKVTDTVQGTETLRTYDSLDHITSECLGNGLALEFAYDTMGRVTNVTYPDKTGARYHYNVLDLTSVSRYGYEGGEQYRHSYKSLDLQGRLLKAKRATGASDLTCRWDSLGRRVKTSTGKWSQSLDNFDAAGNLLQASYGGYTTDYSYDDLYQLTSESGHISHDYSHDSIHNRRSKDGRAHTISHLNQITHDGKTGYTYDPCGNLISQETDGEITYYSYDALDRLTMVEMPHLTVTYGYDDQGRRLWKRLSTGKEQRFLYHAESEIGSYDSQDTSVDFRLLGRGQGGEVGASIAIELGDDCYIPVHDHRGNISCLETTWGCHARTYYYDAYGVVYDKDGQEVPQTTRGNPWRFCSKRHDPHTGLVHFGARDYLPRIGRWLSPDPAGFADGPNLYAYVHNAPMTHYDPYGLYTMVEEREGGSQGILSSEHQGYTHGFVDHIHDSIRGSLESGIAFPILASVLFSSEESNEHPFDRASSWVESSTQELIGANSNDITYQTYRKNTSETLFWGSVAFGAWQFAGPRVVCKGNKLLQKSKGLVKPAKEYAKEVIKWLRGSSAKPAVLAPKTAKMETLLKIKLQKQWSHIPGTNEFRNSPHEFPSIFEHSDPTSLLKRYSGMGKIVEGKPPYGKPGCQEIVNFEEHIGIWFSKNGSRSSPTTRGIIHYGKKGAHIVPHRPNHIPPDVP